VTIAVLEEGKERKKKLYLIKCERGRISRRKKKGKKGAECD